MAAISVVLGLGSRSAGRSSGTWDCNDKAASRRPFVLTSWYFVITSTAVKTELIQMRIAPGDKELFRKAAERAGMSLSEWLADRARWAARRELGTTPTKDCNT